MTRYFITIIAASQFAIQAIDMGRAIIVIGREQPLRIIFEFFKNLFAGCGPEHITPDDRKHRLPSVTKVISGSLPEVANT